MDIARIILGPVVTEKAERQKSSHTYTFAVHPHATKVDVKNALRRFYGVEKSEVRILTVHPKSRAVGAGRTITKRHASKRAIVTLPENAKSLDLANFQTVSR